MDAKTSFAERQDLNIGIVTETYPPEVNGVAMTLNRLVAGLGGNGHSISVYRPAQSKHDSPVTLNNISEIPMPGMPIPGYREMHFGFPAGGFFCRQWQHARPDVLYVATEGPLGASAIRIAVKLNIPVVSGFHTNFHTYSRHYRLGWLAPAILGYLRRLHNRTRMTLVPTGVLATELEASGFNDVRVLQRGVDTSLFTPDRRSDELRWRWNANDDCLVLIYVGRIAAEKNIQMAVDTVLALSSHCKIRFVLVGDGPLREQLKNEHPEFVFCGIRLGEDLAAHYASADVMLFPSRTETFGNVVTEAMASGLAVVAYDEAAAHEHITHWHTGVLAEGNASDSFRSVTMKLCGQPEVLRSIGRNAAEYCKKLDWSTVVSRFEMLLSTTCNGTHSAMSSIHGDLNDE